MIVVMVFDGGAEQVRVDSCCLVGQPLTCYSTFVNKRYCSWIRFDKVIMVEDPSYSSILSGVL